MFLMIKRKYREVRQLAHGLAPSKRNNSDLNIDLTTSKILYRHSLLLKNPATEKALLILL